MDKPDVKIFCSHRIDKKCETIDNPLYVNVRCGAVYDKRNPEDYAYMLGDDTGDNISEKRKSFCELTVLYWAWKNQDADYMGLCHYRRLFSCNKNANNYGFGIHDTGCLVSDFLSKKTYKEFKLSEDELRNEINGYDALFIKPLELNKLGLKSIYHLMKVNHQAYQMKDVDLAIKIAKEKYPEMEKVIDEYIHNYNYSYLYNCFIMKKELFNEYCSWLFDILFELEKHIDTTNYSERQKSAIGIIGEQFMGIYILWLKQQKKYKLNELPLLFINNPEKQEFLNPIFDDQKTVIAVSSSNEYAPYLCVYLQSLIENSDKNKKYDIVVFTKEITDHTKRKLTDFIQSENVSLRFYNPSLFFSDCNLYVTHSYFKEECYYRIAAPLIFSNYEKVIFTDLDLILKDDILKLSDYDIESYIMAACIEPLWKNLYLCNPKILDTSFEKYTNDILKLSNPYDYYNTGVMIINIKKYNQTNSFENLLKLISKNYYLYQEQCAMNVLFKNKIYTLPSVWNYELDPAINNENSNSGVYYDYKKAENNAKIIHYLGCNKPWHNPSEYRAHEWWKYARKTPFYEEIIAKLSSFKSSSSEKNIQSLRNEFEHVHFPIINYHDKLSYIMQRIFYFQLKKFWYKIKRAFAFGKRREKYQGKYVRIKNLIKDARKLKKEYKKI